MSNPRHALGDRAERVAGAWLGAQGWTILARRWRCPDGEIDVVALDPDGVLVAVEVKARGSARSGRPLESVDRRRVRRLRVAIGRFVGGVAGPVVEVRVDLVAVERDQEGRWQLSHHRGIDAW